MKHGSEEVGQNGVSTKDEFSRPSKRRNQGSSPTGYVPAFRRTDGRQVLFATNSGNLWIANTDGSGEFIDILSQWSPDGTHIVISGGRGNGPELWVVRNLLSAEAAEN